MGASATSAAIYSGNSFVGWTDATTVVTFSSPSSGSSSAIGIWFCISSCSFTPTSGGNTFTATYDEQFPATTSAFATSTTTTTSAGPPSLSSVTTNLVIPIALVVIVVLWLSCLSSYCRRENVLRTTTTERKSSALLQKKNGMKRLVEGMKETRQLIKKSNFTFFCVLEKKFCKCPADRSELRQACPAFIPQLGI